MEVVIRSIVRMWKLLNGTLQWYTLWFVHDKFILGVSGVILNEKNQVLLLRHRFWAEGSWGLPGGYVEKRERLEDALKREVLEETGYSVNITSLLRVVSGYKLRLEICYLGYLTGGVLKIDSKEIIEARFFALDKLPDGLLDSHRELITLASHTASSTLQL